MMQTLISQAFCAALEENYAIGRIHDIVALTGGEWNKVFRLSCDKGAFALRISHPTNTLPALAYEHRLLQFMNQRISEVPAPITTDGGATYLHCDGVLVTLFPFMPGRMLNDGNERECIMAAQMFARLQRTGLEYPDRTPRPDRPRFGELNWEYNHWWRWNEVEELLFQRAEAVLETVSDPDTHALTAQIFADRAFIAQEREILRDWVAGVCNTQRALLFAPTHCDYWCNNILLDNGRISAVVDWDGCKAEWLFYALGRATWDFCKDKGQPRLDYQKAVRFLQAYHAAGGPVPSTEFDLLVPVMRCLCLIEVLIGLQDAEAFGVNHLVLYHLLSLKNLQEVKLVL